MGKYISKKLEGIRRKHKFKLPHSTQRNIYAYKAGFDYLRQNAPALLHEIWTFYQCENFHNAVVYQGVQAEVTQTPLVSL